VTTAKVVSNRRIGLRSLSGIALMASLLPRSALLVPLAVGAIGCGDDDERKRRDGGAGGATIGAVIKGVDNPYFATMRDGLQDAARRYGVRLRVGAAAGLDDASGQASVLEGLIDRGASCYVVNPISPSNLIPPLQQVKGDTPVVNMDSPVDLPAARAVGVQVDAYIGTDNEAAGRAAAVALARMVGEGARVAIITGIPGDVGSEARARGFRLGARGHVTVTREVAADFDTRRAAQAMTELLREDPLLAGVFSVNDQMALGAAAAVRREGRDVSVIGMDGIRAALSAIERGELEGTIAQYPFVMGQLAVEACVLRVRGRGIPHNIVAPVQLVTAANVARAKARFPRPVAQVADPLPAGLAG
jgi:ribose transport system substrate-binding protein